VFKLRAFSIAILFLVLISLGLMPAHGVAASGEIAVDGSYNGKTITVHTGDTIKITLGSNPSTGASWSLASNSDPNVLQYIGHQFYPSDSQMMGAPGTEVWTFYAFKDGTSSITLEYRRFTSVGSTYILTINVLPPVPASSTLSTVLLIGGLALVIVIFVAWQSRPVHAFKK
jgi:predicted secreted protein